MMDRGTQRELIKALLQLNEMLRGIDFSDGVQRQTVVEILEAVNKRCNMDFTALKAAVYAESLSGLAQIIGQTDWLNLQAEEKHECRNLCQDIIHIVISKLRQEKEIKKDIVFLPYKASMWDSLESVWRAASEDKEHCNTYVIPIPYADRNPDGTVATWHCEAELFPKDVPVLDWNDYPFEKLKSWHPDVIFIHNPYDNYNAVTSIDKQYYSSNLKKCTDKLVYIPYFVLAELNIEDKSKLVDEEDKIANFILAPGVINADYTIVQSEKMRKVYLDVLERHTDVGREYWEEHIKGLGSPKFDKVVNTAKEDYDLPQEWRNIVQGKKVILYNTGLTTMLRYADIYLKKVKSVIRTFKEHQEVALWWRPHPLLRATLQSMHPELLAEYDDIIDKYRQEGWGIYDDTSDLNRALAWTDGYYGDGSSLQQLYKKECKPVVTQEIENPIDSFVIDENLYLTDGIWQDNELIFPAWNVNGIFSYNIETKYVNFLSFLPANLNVSYLFCRMEMVENKLYFIPTNEDCILIFDMIKKTWNKICIDDGKIGDLRARFSDAYRFDKTIWLKPYYSHAIVSYSTDTGEIVYYDEWYKELEAYITDENSPKFWSGSKSENAIYFPFVQTNKVVEFNVYSKDYEIISVGNDNEHLLNVYYWYGKLYCYNNNDDLLIYDLITRKIIRIENVFGQSIEGVSMIEKNRILWLFAWKKDAYVKFNITSMNFEKIDDYLSGVDIGYPTLEVRNDKIYLYPNQTPYMLIIDIDDNRVEKNSIAIPRDYKEMWKEKVIEQMLMREEKELSLVKKYIKVFSERVERHEEDNMGEKIYQKVLCWL